jgi:hypothetical protein
MRKALTSIAAAGALAAATVSVPTQANALAQWVVPVIVVAGVGGAIVGSVAANAAYAPPAYAPAGNVYVQPRPTAYVQPRVAAKCHIVRERTASGWRRVEVCD